MRHIHSISLIILEKPDFEKKKSLCENKLTNKIVFQEKEKSQEIILLNREPLNETPTPVKCTF